MNPENKPNINDFVHDLEAVVNKIDGFYDGKISEIDDEIIEVSAWTRDVKLGTDVIRKKQALAALEKLRRETHGSKDHVVSALSQLVEKYTKPSMEPPQ